MNWKQFLKPTKWTIIAFIILVFLSYLLYTYIFPIKIFQCKIQPLVPNPQGFKDSICGLDLYSGSRIVGVSISFTPLGYLEIIIMLLILPYIISFIINSLIKRK